MPKYPAQIDTSQSLPTAVDNLTPVQGSVFNRLRDAVLAIETELGVKPSGISANVAARLNVLEGIVGNLKEIEIQEDIGGTLESPLVIGLQGRPISSVAPSIGQVLGWNGIAWVPSPGGTGGGGGNGTFFVDQLTPPFTINLQTTNLVEVGQTVTNPAFTATYFFFPTQPVTPQIDIFADSDNLGSQNVESTPNAFNSIFSFTKNTFGASVTFTLTSTVAPITKSVSTDITWTQKLYWGIGIPAQSGAGFITSLAGQALTTSKDFAFSINPGVGEKVYFACRSAYGDVVFTVHDVEGGFTKTGTFSVTNTYGFVENYDLYESDNTNLGSILVITGEGDDEFIGGGGPVGPPGPPGSGGGSGPGGLIIDADVSPIAAIQGTKILPTFGNQEIITKNNVLANDYLYYPKLIPIDGYTVIYWNLNELTTPFANTGTGSTQNLLMTPFSPSAFTSGLFDGGINLNGVLLDDTLDTPITTALRATSLSTWVNPTSLAGGTVVAKKYDTSGSHTAPFDAISINLAPSSDGSTLFRITIAGVNTDLTVTTPKLTVSNWHHVGCTWDGNKFIAYIDGKQVASSTLGPAVDLDFGPNGKWFAGNFGAPDTSVNLIVDDIRAESTVRTSQYFTDVYIAGIFPNLATSAHPGDLFMVGDLGGSGQTPKVIGLQGIPVATTTPTNGQVLTYVSADGKWEPMAGGGGGGAAYIADNGNQVGIVPVAAVVPVSPPLAGFLMYVDPVDGKLKVLGSSGTITVIGSP